MRVRDAGDLTERVSITRTGESQDANGNPVTVTENLGTVWAHVEKVSGQERVIADNLAGVTTYRLTLWNDGPGAAITAAHTLTWHSRNGDIALNVRQAGDAGSALQRLIEAEAGVVNS